MGDPDNVDFGALVAHAEWVSARPFAIIRAGFGVIHRGIGNTGDFHRVLFWIPVKKPGAPLPLEPLLRPIGTT